MEADLARYYLIDLRDLQRHDQHGRVLTLQMVFVRLWALLRWEPSSFTAQALGGSGWTRTDHLLADVWQALSGESHPSRPVAPNGHDGKLDAARKRAQERQSAIESGEIA